ncbi:MAG: Hpt domain-containing protein [Chloroflexota bacterium]|nr:Hpt domain-containing protein [Chloroflexota bacterium]
MTTYTTTEDAIDQRVIESLRDLQEDGEPDLLDELVQMFLTDAAPRLTALRGAVALGTPLVIETQAHALKGSCANFGARPMSAICEVLQSAGRSGELATASGLLAPLQAEFERVRDALNAELVAV